MIIKNRQSLATTEQRRQALDIIEAAIVRVLPDVIMRSAVSFDSTNQVLTIKGDPYDISKGRIFVIGGGKASGHMAAEIENIIGQDRITAGTVTCKSEDGRERKGIINVIPAGHPVPDQRGVDAVRDMLKLKQVYDINDNDLILCLISGGGSALMPCPAEGITLAVKQRITGLLLGCGADITDINTVRKHLSGTKGGRLGRYFAPARVVSLILSDVIGNDLSVIASGPTYPDKTTFSGALGILKQYDVLTDAPAEVIDYLKKGERGLIEETPAALDNCYNYIIGDSQLALNAMKQKALELGLKPHIITTAQDGDTTTAARSRAQEVLSGRYRDYTALFIGGETTPTLPAQSGKGGRNQHYAAVSMLEMSAFPGEWTIASAGTDGSDFLAEAAGAIVDRGSVEEAAKQKLDVVDHLNRFDSHTLLKSIGSCLIETGDTGTNVGDVVVYLIKTGL